MKTVKSSEGFLGLPSEIKSKNKVLIIPFGLENTVSYESGTKMGPKKIIKASHQVELFDDELKRVIIHGVLHFMGFNDKTDDEKSLIRKKEDSALEMFHVKQ